MGWTESPRGGEVLEALGGAGRLGKELENGSSYSLL